MDIKPIIPIIAIIIAPRKALPKLLTSKPGTSAAASIIIKALITNANKPNVTTVKGAVKNHNAGRIKALINPSTVAAIKNDKTLLAFMPDIIKVAKPSPIAVANQAISRAVIVSIPI